MKKFLIMFFMLMAVPVFADTMPFYVNSVPKDAIGVYQTGKKVVLYSHPDANSDVIKRFELTYKPATMPSNVFGVLLNEKELGLMYVTDIGDEGWVEVIYDKTTGARGKRRNEFVSKLNYAKVIKLTKIQGNWALVTVKDIDEVPKTGFMKWRNSDGTIYAFPDIK